MSSNGNGNGNPEKFVGLTKVGFFIAFSTLLLVTVCVLGVLLSLKSTEGTQAHTALCAIRNQNADNIVSSRKFLVKNPNGIPGIPAYLIRDGISRQTKLVALLDKTLNC